MHSVILALNSYLMSIYYNVKHFKVRADAFKCVQVREMACTHVRAVPRSFLAARCEADTYELIT